MVLSPRSRAHTRPLSVHPDPPLALAWKLVHEFTFLAHRFSQLEPTGENPAGARSCVTQMEHFLPCRAGSTEQRSHDERGRGFTGGSQCT